MLISSLSECTHKIVLRKNSQRLDCSIKYFLGRRGPLVLPSVVPVLSNAYFEQPLISMIYFIFRGYVISGREKQQHDEPLRSAREQSTRKDRRASVEKYDRRSGKWKYRRKQNEIFCVYARIQNWRKSYEKDKKK